MKRKLLELLFVSFLSIRMIGDNARITIISNASWSIYWTTDFKTFERLGSVDAPNDGLFYRFDATDENTVKFYKYGFYVLVERQ